MAGCAVDLTVVQRPFRRNGHRGHDFDRMCQPGQRGMACCALSRGHMVAGGTHGRGGFYGEGRGLCRGETHVGRQQSGTHKCQSNQHLRAKCRTMKPTNHGYPNFMRPDRVISKPRRAGLARIFGRCPNCQRVPKVFRRDCGGTLGGAAGSADLIGEVLGIHAEPTWRTPAHTGAPSETIAITPRTHQSTHHPHDH